MKKPFTAISACVLALSACASTRPLDLQQPQRGIDGPCAPPARVAPSTRARSLGSQALYLRIQIDLAGREFLSASGQSVVIASAERSDGDTVIIRSALDPIAEETTVTFEPVSILYVSSRLYVAFDTIAMNYCLQAQDGQAYAFTGTQLVGTGTSPSGYFSIYYDAPPNSSQPVTVGIAAIDSDAPTPGPISHYAVQRFETRLVPVASPLVWVFIAGGIKRGEVIPASALQPVRSVRAGEGGSPAVQLSPRAPLFGGYLSVDLMATEQNVIHFDLMSNSFQYGPYR